jgi:hypothetical protein
MPKSNIVSQIIDRRQQIKNELELHQDKAIFCRVSINNIDMTMIFCDEKPVKIVRKRRHIRHPKIFKHGMISLLFMDGMRNSGIPLPLLSAQRMHFRLSKASSSLSRATAASESPRAAALSRKCWDT